MTLRDARSILLSMQCTEANIYTAQIMMNTVQIMMDTVEIVIDITRIGAR